MTPNFDEIHIQRTYPSKILLFGEYTVLLNGQALAIPCHAFSGKWTYGLPFDWSAMTQFLSSGEFQHFKKDKWLNSVSSQLYFDSNIPFGYGLGSSGSLAAAIYQDFFIQSEIATMAELRQTLAQIESHFHGKSSGFDPLISYTDKAIRMAGNDMQYIDSQDISLQNFFLVDSGSPRNTASLVNRFQSSLIENEFKHDMEAIKEVVDQIIPLFLQKDETWLSYFKQISEKQLKIMYQYIPENIYKIWNNGLLTGEYYIKFCGAGGGGYFLSYGKSPTEGLNFIPLVS